MATRSARIPYTNTDYESLRAALIQRIPQLTPLWTDFNESDLGVVLLDLFCGVGDMLLYYVDTQASEGYLQTARQRHNLASILRLIGYRLDTAVSSSTTLEFSLDLPLAENLTIPAGTVCTASEDGMPFETVETAVLPLGTTSVQVPAIQGERVTDASVGTGGTTQVLTVSRTGIAQGSVAVTVGGVAWSEVETFVDSASTDGHFVVDTDGLGVTRVTFGDGANGAVPPANAAVAVSYLVTMGAGGNIAPSRVDTVSSTIRLHGVPVALSVANVTQATGGAAEETLDHARAHGPAELKTMWRAVTVDDYHALVSGVPGVAKAQVLDANDCSNIRYWTVRIAVAPEGGGLPSSLLKDRVLAFINARRVLTTEVIIDDPAYRAVPVVADLYLLAGQNAEIVKAACQASLEALFAFAARGFGDGVYLSDIYAALDTVAGVNYVTLLAPTADMTANPGEILTLGTVTLTVRGGG